MSVTLALPASPAGLTAEWLTGAFREGGFLTEGRVSAVEHEIIGAGIGFIGIVARLRLTYEGVPAQLPATLIAKLPSEDPGSRMVGVAFGLYEREVRFYESLATSCGIPAPTPYFARYDAAAGQAALLLEDLQGGHWGDQVAGATPEEVAIGIDALGKFHARWWQSPDLSGHAWITSGIEILRQPIQMMYDAVWKVALEKYAHLFPAYIRDMVPSLGRRTMSALDAMGTLPETLIHGDFRPDNMFFGGPARPLVVCDWQSPSRGPAITDTAYFITGSLEPDDRRAQEDELLRRYHALLLEGGVQGYSFEQLKTDYRGYFAGVVAAGVVLLGTLPEGNERGRLLIEASMRRFIAAMEDHDSLALLPE